MKTPTIAPMLDAATTVKSTAFQPRKAPTHAMYLTSPKPIASRSKKTSIVDTTVGRSLLQEILPEGLPYQLANTELSKKNISRLINSCYRMLGLKDTVVSMTEVFCEREPSSATTVSVMRTLHLACSCTTRLS